MNKLVTSYDAQDRLTQYKDNTYQYNALGQLTQKTTPSGTETYDYDVFGNLRSVNLANGDTIEYLIDPKDRRIGKKVNGTITQKLLYLGQLNPIAELYPDNSIKNLFIFADKSNVPSAMERYDESGNLTGKYRIISNHLGSVVMVVNTVTGDIAQEIEYDVWGNILSDTNPNFQPFYFAGGIYDTDTKLTRFGARDYDAEAGRWTAKDPIGFNGGLTSLYNYVGGDPVNFIDPNGLETEIVQWGKSGGFHGRWGHISGNINGKNWSFGPKGWDTQRPKFSDYVKRQTDDIKRGGRSVVLDLFPDEEEQLESCLASHSADYSSITNNCGNPFLSCLSELDNVVDLKDKATILPIDVYRILKKSPRLIRENFYLGERLPVGAKEENFRGVTP